MNAPQPHRRLPAVPLRVWAPVLTAVVVCIVVGLFVRACNAPETAPGTAGQPAWETGPPSPPDFTVQEPKGCLPSPADSLDEISGTLRTGTKLGLSAAAGTQTRLFIAARIENESGTELRTEPALWVVVAGKLYAVAANTWTISSAPTSAAIGIGPDDEGATDATMCAVSS